MEFTTDLVLRSKFDSVTTSVVPRAHLPPTLLDWQRWAPTIAARYKCEPARVLIGEMHADGLLVTEKMFRDRLRQWGLNIKNRRSAAKPRRKALQLANNRGKGARSGPQHTTAYRSSTQATMLDYENVYNVLRTPNEILVLECTLKSVLDWQKHIESPQGSVEVVSNGKYRLSGHLVSISNALNANRQAPWMCGKVTQVLQRESEAFRTYIGATCTPAAIFQSIKWLINIAHGRNHCVWYYQTSKFIVNIAAEILPSTHPLLILLRLIFNEPTAEQLAMVYEIGSNTVRRCHGGANADSFRAKFLTAVIKKGLGATFRSFAESLCTSSSDTNDVTSLLRIAEVYYSMHHYDECESLVRKCLTRLKVEGKENTVDSITAIYLLSTLQKSRNDFGGEEKSLRRYLAIKMIMDRRSCAGPQLSMSVLVVVAKLDSLYRRQDLGEQRDALRLEFPDAFEA